MKILDNFNTKLDEEELNAALLKFPGKAILTKKHRMFLFVPLIFLFLSIGLFAILVTVSYQKYVTDHLATFWIIVVLQFTITLIWIIHSIQTIISIIKKHRNRAYFGSVNTKSLNETGKFEHYLKHSFISLILQIILMILDVALSIVLKEQDTKAQLMLVGGVLLNILFIFIIFMTVYKVIDYEMWFNIFTPEQFSIHRQKSIFSSETINIQTNNIKAIKDIQKGVIASLFGFGKIAISRGEQDEPTKIAYVAEPKKLVKKLNEFISKKAYDADQ